KYCSNNNVAMEIELVESLDEICDDNSSFDQSSASSYFVPIFDGIHSGSNEIDLVPISRSTELNKLHVLKNIINKSFGERKHNLYKLAFDSTLNNVVFDLNNKIVRKRRQFVIAYSMRTSSSLVLPVDRSKHVPRL